MKIREIKQEIFTLTCTNSTQQLKKERPDLTQGLDLRYKQQWTNILEKLKVLRLEGKDLSLKELEQSEQMLQESLFEIGHIAGLSDDQIKIDWQRIQLEAQFRDVHLEEL
ncbi:MAG: hypothetical protein F6K14_25030 [Symploca sp. SIO2C1]|nr:hypothetical protein [Symploca sp. SIO2C1]